AIEEASAYAVVISTDALQSKWVGKELRHALTIRDQRGKENFPVIPLSLNGTKLGVLEEFFEEEPVYIPVSSDAGGVEAAMNAIRPSEYFKERARKVEQSLKEWGRALYDSAFPAEHVANVREAWAKVPAESHRRFSVFVKSRVVAGALPERQEAAREAATLLLALPWELIHDGKGFLFQSAHPTRVRRRLPRTESFDVPVVATPIRILLVTAR